MRISVKRDPELIGNCDIFVNEENITKDCFFADDEMQKVIVNKRNEDGLCFLNKRKTKICTEVLTGDVRIELNI